MDASDVITLRGGLTVHVAPLLLLLSLEERGIRVFRDGNDIVIEPWSRLTEQDKTDLRRWKSDALALLSYVAPELVQ